MSRERKPPHKVIVRGTGFVWSFVVGLALAAALIVFIAQNTEQVTVHWTVWKVRSSLAVVVLVTVAVAIVIAELVGLVWRHRRRRLISRRESLRAEPAAPTAALETAAGPGEAQPSVSPPEDAGGASQPSK